MVLFAHYRKPESGKIATVLSLMNMSVSYAWGPLSSTRTGSRNLHASSDTPLYLTYDSETDLVTLVLDLEDATDSHLESFTHWDRYLVQVMACDPVADRELVDSDPAASLHWDRIGGYVDGIYRATEPQTGSVRCLADLTCEALVPVELPAEQMDHEAVPGVEYSQVRDVTLASDVRDRHAAHTRFLELLGSFISYRFRTEMRGDVDHLVRATLDEILTTAHDLQQDPERHTLLAQCVEGMLDDDRSSGVSFYYSLNSLRSAAALTRYELGSEHPDLPTVLDDFQRQRWFKSVGGLCEAIGNFLGLGQLRPDRLMDVKYSGDGLLRQLITLDDRLKNASTDPLRRLMGMVLTHGSFNSYLRADDGKEASRVLENMKGYDFDATVFVARQRDSDILTREEGSRTSWQRNFDSLIRAFRDRHFGAFFMEYTGVGNQQRMNKTLRSRVQSYTSDDGFSRTRSRVYDMLHVCKSRIQARVDRGQRVDTGLTKLEQRLDNLWLQMESGGGRPTGGMLVARRWHRGPEDLSNSKSIGCCAALGGSRENLTFAALFNPAYSYIAYGIRGIHSPLGYSIMTAGRSPIDNVGHNVMLAVSPYEAHQSITTALGKSQTYWFVLDSMAVSARDGNSEFLYIDDIDLKVWDSDDPETRRPVKMLNGEAVFAGEDNYDHVDAKEIMIQYRQGIGNAPRSFRGFMMRVVKNKKYSSVTWEDVDYRSIEGVEELAQHQLGDDVSHYAIQNIRHVFDPSKDYNNLSEEETAEIYDKGTDPMNGVRTVFKIGVSDYFKQRAAEGVDLTRRAKTVYGRKLA